MGSTPPPGAQISPDGKWFWDGTKWQPVAATPAPGMQLATTQPAAPVPTGPPPAYAYGPRTNSLAIASLVTGILSWVLCPFLAAVLAIIFGHVARSQIKQTGEAGGGMAIAGLVLGYINIGGAILLFVFWIVFGLGLAILGALIGSIPSPTPTPSGG